MVKHFSLDNVSKVAIKALINSHNFVSALNNSRSILIQYYSACTNEQQLSQTIIYLKEKLPSAIIVGATTVGEIVDGRSVTGKDILGFTLFETSQIDVIHQTIEKGHEKHLGYELGQTIENQYSNVKGVLLLSTPLSIDAAELLNGIEQSKPNYQVFGGGAGDYASLNNSIVCCQEFLYQRGVVAVVLSGEDLTIESDTYLGWRPLSRAFIATEVDGLIVKQIDDMPAYEVYKKYLDLNPDEDLFLNALEFPFLLHRNGKMLARVPVDVTSEGGLVFVADINQGEKLTLGYGDPALIVQGSELAQQQISKQEPEVIFLYSCGCRRFLMQEDVELETLPFQHIAPTFGFYTYGEFYSDQGCLPLLNSTMVTVSIKEKGGESTRKEHPIDGAKTIEAVQDPYANKHIRIVSKLVQFINATTQELNQANDAKSQFLANTSHELRTPLTTISGYTEALLNGDIKQQDWKHAIEIIQHQSDHLLTLINDVLDISRIEAQKLPLSFSDFNLHALLEELAETFQHQAKLKSLTFSLHIDKQVPNSIHSEAERLNQILINLCSNAIKYTDQGTVDLFIAFDTTNSELIAKVKDTGVGLTTTQQQTIFQPFSQVKQKAQKSQGSGLGLSICQQLSKALNGQLRVESESGVGSTFTFTLPIKLASQSLAQSEQVKHNSQIGEHNYRILLAEDSIENGQLFKLILENAGLSVDLVENGEQALEITATIKYDLILLDIQMPILDGLETHNMMRFSGIDCPILAITANAMAHDINKYLQHGFNDCISKPVKAELLISTVFKYLNLNKDNELQPLPDHVLQQLFSSAKQSLKNEIRTISPELIDKEKQEVFHKIKGMAVQIDLAEIANLAHKLEQQPHDESSFIDLKKKINAL
jgi:signal transduction histidine kinase/CheY-like chemotaxis protein